MDRDDQDDEDLRRATAVAVSGARGAVPRAEVARLVTQVTADRAPRVRFAALGVLVRCGPPGAARRAWRSAAVDADATVRRRAAELAPAVGAPLRALLALLGDADPLVAEAAAWALGEQAWVAAATRGRVVRALAAAARAHDDPLVREAAVAALGAVGDERGLDAILAACTDKPAVRRRAVLALAPFSGARVEAALTAALEDRDWQVRQAAEDLT